MEKPTKPPIAPKTLEDAIRESTATKSTAKADGKPPLLDVRIRAAEVFSNGKPTGIMLIGNEKGVHIVNKVPLTAPAEVLDSVRTFPTLTSAKFFLRTMLKKIG